MDLPVTDICSFLGLCATAMLTFNFLIGLLLGTAYKKHPYWKKVPAFIRKIGMIRIHNITAYVALGLLLLHPVVLLFDATTKFNLAGITIPFATPVQTVWVALGIISMYCIVLVIITTQRVVRKKMGYRSWKNIHMLSYLSLILICIHGTFMDPQLKNRPPDFIDAEKMVSELCLLVLLGAVVLRYRYYLLHQAPHARNSASQDVQHAEP